MRITEVIDSIGLACDLFRRNGADATGARASAIAFRRNQLRMKIPDFHASCGWCGSQIVSMMMAGFALCVMRATRNTASSGLTLVGIFALLGWSAMAQSTTTCTYKDSAYSCSNTDLVIDINGYFAPPVASLGMRASTWPGRWLRGAGCLND